MKYGHEGCPVCEQRLAKALLQNVNQCDGCRRGLPIENKIHHEADGHPYMMCERSKYEPRDADAAEEDG